MTEDEIDRSAAGARNAGPERAPIDDAAAWRAMKSPIRAELLGLIEAEQPCSVGDLARVSGRRPEAIYSHVKILICTGFIHQDGVRRTTGRPEVLYRATSKARGFWVSAIDRDTLEHYSDIEEAVLRAMARGFRRMFRLHYERVPGTTTPPRLHARHEVTWLDEDRARRLGQLLAELNRLVVEGRNARTGVRHQIDTLVWRREGFDGAPGLEEAD